jgi:hypothetical protein
MACDKRKIKMIIAKSIDEQWIILQCPEDFEYLLDGALCKDNGFQANTYPEEGGVYEIECEASWKYDDNIDPEWDVKITSHTLLIKLEHSDDQSQGLTRCSRRDLPEM